MIKTIVSIFAIYGAQLSSSQAPWDPPSQQGPPVAVQPVQPMQPPATPQAVPGMGQPQPPMGQPPMGQPPMGQPQGPAVIPGAPGQAPGAPGVGAPVWVPPVIPSLTSPAAQTSMSCTLPNTARAGCAGRTTSITNAGRNYNMECSAVGACASSMLEFKYQNSFTERVERVSFSEMYAGYGATVRIDSTESLRKQYLDKFECKAYGACQNTVVELFGGSSLNDVDCPYPSNCQGCTISVCEWGPINPMTGLKSKLCGTPKPCFGY